MSTNFALTTSSPNTNIIQSLNYLLATQSNVAGGTVVNYNGNVLVANTVTGTITGVTSNGAPTTGTISYLYGYVDVKYANSATGGTGFTSNCVGAQYYGVYNNSTGIESSNPVNYQWTQVAGGFGNTKSLFYTTSGGNTINFAVGNAAPSIYYQPVIDNIPILLALAGNSTVTANSIQLGTITNAQIAGNTITGYNIRGGTITANLIAANTIFASQSIQSSNATFGNASSVGFWLASANGNARFGGNINIGNNLIVGNNAVIGGNLNVNGLVTAGNLQSNTVITTTLVSYAVSQGVGINSSTTQSYSFPNNYTVYPYTYIEPSITTVINGENVYVNAQVQMRLNFTYQELTTVTLFLNRSTSGGNVQLGPTQSFTFANAAYSSYSYVTAAFTYFDTPFPTSTGNAQYFISAMIPSATGSAISTFEYDNGTMVLQGMKR